MKKVYLIEYNNGEKYPEDYEEYTFKYCYSSKKQANQAIEELIQDKDFLENVNYFDPEAVNFRVVEIELVD